MAAEPLHRILVIGPRGISGHEGGVEKFAEEFVPRAARQAHVAVLCLSAAEGEPPENVEVVLVPKSKLLNTDKAFYLLYALWVYATRPFDRVLILGMNFAILIPLFKMMFWRRAEFYARTGSIDYTLPKWGRGMRLFMRLSERMMGLADGVVAVAPSLKRHLDGLGITSRVIRNGLDRELRPPAASRHRMRSVLTVGRITPQKNYGVLIDAAKVLADRAPPVTIVGGADLSGEADHLALKLSDCPEGVAVEMTGRLGRPEILEMLRDYGLFVNCSHHEGMSNSVMEAIQEGIPVVLSDIEANRDLGLPDRFYFDQNNPHSLAAKIEEALDAPQDFVVDPRDFDDWDTAIGNFLRFMNAGARESEALAASAA